MSNAIVKVTQLVIPTLDSCKLKDKIFLLPNHTYVKSGRWKLKTSLIKWSHFHSVWGAGQGPWAAVHLAIREQSHLRKESNSRYGTRLVPERYPESTPPAHRPTYDQLLLHVTVLNVYGGILGCEAVQTCRLVPTLRKKMLSPPWTLKMEAVCSSKTSVRMFKSARHHNPQDRTGVPVFHPSEPLYVIKLPHSELHNLIWWYSVVNLLTKP
jgi:hypothetical protein